MSPPYRLNARPPTPTPRPWLIRRALERCRRRVLVAIGRTPIKKTLITVGSYVGIAILCVVGPIMIIVGMPLWMICIIIYFGPWWKGKAS